MIYIHKSKVNKRVYMVKVVVRAETYRRFFTLTLTATLTPTRGPCLVAVLGKTLLRAAILSRTHDVFKNPYITLFLHIIFGPDYYVPP